MSEGGSGGSKHEYSRLVDEIETLKSALERAKRAESAFSDSEARYRSLFEALAEGVVMQAHDGSILACNAAAQEILGLTEDQMCGRTSLDPRWRAVRENGDGYPGEEHPAMVTLRTGKPIFQNIMGVHKPDGTLTWISINTQLVPIEGSPPGVVASFTDITAIRNAKERLEKSEAWFRLALSAAHVGIWEWNILTHEITWSDEVYDLFSIPRREEVTFEKYESRIHPDDRELLQKTIERAMEDPAAGGTYEVEHRTAPLPGAPLRWVRGSGQVIFDGAGRPQSMRGAVMDVTEKKLLEEQAMRAGRMESIGRLAGGVSHDFNNLLTAILGAVDVGLLDLKNESEVRESFETIEKAASHASQLTRQLLTFAKRQSLTLQSCDLDALLDDTRGLLRHLLDEHVELSVKLGAGGWHARLEPTQMQQVIVNLAANARDAMPGGGKLSVSVEQLVSGDPRLGPQHAGSEWLLLSVTDTGEGMSEDVRTHAFDPFFSTKEAGTGLGLATSYGIVEQCGGHIECTSAPSKGTTFSIYLPRFVDIHSPVQPPAEALEPLQPKRILVVEDQESILRVVVHGLERAGLVPLRASSGEEAVQILEGDSGLDLLLSDIVMPGIGGVEVARRARELYPDLPIVFMSGYARDFSVLEEFDATDILEKPFRVKTLVEKIQAALDVK